VYHNDNNNELFLFNITQEGQKSLAKSAPHQMAAQVQSHWASSKALGVQAFSRRPVMQKRRQSLKFCYLWGFPTTI